MDATLILAAAIAVCSLGFGVRWWTWRPVMKRRAMVQTDVGVSFNGIVVSRRGALLVLADVTVFAEGGSSSRADGQVVVDRARVLWMQVSD